MLKRIRFLIVDDHATVRDGLEHLLSAEFPDSTFASAANAAEASERSRHESFDIVILDVNLPGQDGIGLIRQFKDHHPWIRVLIHTMHPEDQLGIRALRAGADGYLTKDRPVAELFEAVERLREGRRYISTSLGERLAHYVTSKAEGRDGVDLLSDREYQILRMLTAGKSPTQIADELTLSIKTISTYRSKILEKLRLATTADLIRFGISHNVQ
jgi:two-component system, NarL family, invasion response regulator UvrY